MTITSPHNAQLKEIRRLASRRDVRTRAGRFVAEGEDLLAAADAAGWEALQRYCAAGSGLAGTEVDPQVLGDLSELGSGTRALAVYAERWASEAPGPVCVSLHGVRDPGNVGTILRSAWAFGAAGVAIGADTADPFSPRAVRASMGAVFGVAVHRTGGELGALPRPLVALSADGDTPLRAVGDVAGADGVGTLMVGAERAGLPAAVREAADVVVRIPIATDSLNAAMAATIALYEVNRMAAR